MPGEGDGKLIIKRPKPNTRPVTCLKVRCGGGGVRKTLSFGPNLKLKFWSRPKLNNCSGGRKEDDL